LFPYIGETPVSRQVKEFNSVDDIYEEIAEISNASDGKRTMGQEMWYLVPIFANPQYLLNEESFNLIMNFTTSQITIFRWVKPWMRQMLINWNISQ